MTRIGDLLPDAARGLGLEEELRLSRAMATFEAIVAERVPAAAGACRVLRLDGFDLVVEADAPIVAQELRLRAPRAPRCVRRVARPGSACANCGSMSGAEAPAYNPANLPAARLRGRAVSIDPGSASRRPAPPIDHRRPPHERRMAVRLQMKLGVIAEPDRVIDSPDTVVVVEPSVGSVARSKGNLYLIVTSTVAQPAGAGGDPARRRDDPERVLLRRVGRDPGLPREGDRLGEQAAGPPARSARAARRRR